MVRTSNRRPGHVTSHYPRLAKSRTLAMLSAHEVESLASEVSRAARDRQQIPLLSHSHPGLTSHNAYQVTRQSTTCTYLVGTGWSAGK